MLALDRSGCLLAWNNLPNEQTVPFIFKDAGKPRYPPFPLSFHILPQISWSRSTLPDFWAAPSSEEKRAGSHLADLGLEPQLERQMSPGHSEFSPPPRPSKAQTQRPVETPLVTQVAPRPGHLHRAGGWRAGLVEMDAPPSGGA